MLDQMITVHRKSLADLFHGRILKASSDLLTLLTALDLSYELTSNDAEVLISDNITLVSTDLINAALPVGIAYEHHWVIDSTNKYLMARPHQDETRVCTAEMQISGRGRRGRSWVSPFGKNIYLSWLSTLELPMREMTGLSLAVGVRVAALLRRLGCPQAGLKWPNDLMTEAGKLGGILIELEPVTQNRTRVCIGMGLNVFKAPKNQDIGRSATCLADFGQWDRTSLIIVLIEELKQLVDHFDGEQMHEIQQRWTELDLYHGRTISVAQDDQEIEGLNQGIDLQGQLVLNCGEKLRYFNAGEVSVRIPESP